MLGVMLSPLQAQPLSGAVEDRIKAAYLYNFTKFIEWPSSAFATAESPFVIGVIDPTDEMFKVVSETLGGKTTLSGLAIEVRRIASGGADLTRVQLLFVAHEAALDAATIKASVATSPVLLVGETENFAARGGAIGFLVAGDGVRIEVNLAAAQRAGLKLSGRLASVAHLVREQRP